MRTNIVRYNKEGPLHGGHLYLVKYHINPAFLGFTTGILNRTVDEEWFETYINGLGHFLLPVKLCEEIWEIKDDSAE